MPSDPLPLSPCPFCGGAGYHVREERGPGYADFPDDPDRWAYSVRCRSCAAQGPWTKSSQESADRKWNEQEARTLARTQTLSQVAEAVSALDTPDWMPFEQVDIISRSDVLAALSRLGERE